MFPTSEIREILKGAAQVVAGLTGAGLLLEAMTAPGNGTWAAVLLVSGGVWLHMHAADRGRERTSAVRSAFGIPEEDFRATFGLSEGEVTALLNDPVARARFLAELGRRMQGVGMQG